MRFAFRLPNKFRDFIDFDFFFGISQASMESASHPSLRHVEGATSFFGIKVGVVAPFFENVDFPAQFLHGRQILEPQNFGELCSVRRPLLIFPAPPGARAGGLGRPSRRGIFQRDVSFISFIKIMCAGDLKIWLVWNSVGFQIDKCGSCGNIVVNVVVVFFWVVHFWIVGRISVLDCLFA